MKYYKDSDNQTYVYQDDGSEDHLIPSDQIKITEEEANILVDQEFNAQPYFEKRVREYPSIGDQLDALFHAGVFPEEMAAQIQAVKDKYPKE